MQIILNSGHNQIGNSGILGQKYLLFSQNDPLYIFLCWNYSTSSVGSTVLVAEINHLRIHQYLSLQMTTPLELDNFEYGVCNHIKCAQKTITSKPYKHRIMQVFT